MKNEPLLGHLIDGEQQRDAIHIAIAPVVAYGSVGPGQPIGFIQQGDTRMVSVAGPVFIGIADPFLKERIWPGEWFWMFLYPNTISSLRHDWTHPAFQGYSTHSNEGQTANEVSAAVTWLEEFAKKASLSYLTVIDAGRTYIETGDSYIQEGSQSARNAFAEPGVAETFWRHLETVTGLKNKQPDFQDVFQCSC